MTEAAMLQKIVEVLRLVISAVGFVTCLEIWLLLREGGGVLLRALARMFMVITIVLFLASGANLIRVAWGTQWFANSLLAQLALVALFGSMVGGTMNFWWRLRKIERR